MATGQCLSHSQEALKTSLLPKGSSVHSPNMFDSDMEGGGLQTQTVNQKQILPCQVAFCQNVEESKTTDLGTEISAVCYFRLFSVCGQ